MPGPTAAPSQSPRRHPAIRASLGLEAGHYLAVLVHQELGEVPLDLAAVAAVKNWYSGALSSPFTEIFAYIGKVTLYLLLQKVLISSLVPGSWPPKCWPGTRES